MNQNDSQSRIWSFTIRILVIFYIAYCVLRIQDSLTTGIGYPYLYNWTDLFINYSGGFIRRGLLGHILFFLAPHVSLYYVIVITYIIIFFVFTYTSYLYLSKSFDRIITLLVFISPAYFLFHINPGVLIKKDVIIYLLVFISYNISVSCILKKDRKLIWPTLLILGLYAFAFLIHEMALFYFPLSFVLLGVAFKKENKLRQWLFIGAIVVVASLLVSYIFRGTIEQRYAICAAWRQYYPMLSCPNVFSYDDLLSHYVNAFSYIGKSLWENLAFVTPYYRSPLTLASAACGAVLSFLPLALICLGYRSFQGIKGVFLSPVLRYFFWAAACAPWIMPLIASDFGRHISGACLSYLFFVLSIQRIAPVPYAGWLQKWNTRAESSSRYRWLILAVVLIYGLGWELQPWTAAGSSFVQPGILARIPFHKITLLFSSTL